MACSIIDISETFLTGLSIHEPRWMVLKSHGIIQTFEIAWEPGENKGSHKFIVSN